jgi:hypothetical protein
MKNEFSFAQFNQALEGKGQDSIEDKSGRNYVLMVLQQQMTIEEINFAHFDYADICDVHDELDSLITNDDQDGGIQIDPNHSYTRILAMSGKTYKLGKLPKHKLPSPFLFI